MGGLLQLLTSVEPRTVDSKEESERSEKATWAPVEAKRRDSVRGKKSLVRMSLGLSRLLRRDQIR